jgi:Domain of unknown function (DUF6379)
MVGVPTIAFTSEIVAPATISVYRTYGEALPQGPDSKEKQVSATERVIGTDELRIDAQGKASVAVRLPWYRSLAPSTIEDVVISVNGEPVPSDKVTVEINGREDHLAGISGRWEETWFVQDRAIVRFPYNESDSDSAEVSAALTLRIPYILTGPASALSRTTQETRKLTIVREEQS